MKYLVFSILLSVSAFADLEEGDCEKSVLTGDLASIATDLQVPNCNNLKYTGKKNLDPLCKKCIPKFKANISKHNDIKAKEQKIDLNKVLLDELKRSLSANLLDIVNLRSLSSTSADFTAAMNSCDLSAFQKKLSQQPCSKGISLQGLSNQIAEELGNILSKKPMYNDKGLLDRRNATATCDISDIEIMRAQSTLFEKSLNSGTMDKLLTLNGDNRDSFLESVMKSFGEGFSASLNQHPVFSQLIAPPTNLKAFIKALKKPFSTDDLKEALYTSKNSTTTLSASIAKKCSDSFAAYEKAICNSDLKNGKVRIKNLAEAERIVPIPSSHDGEYVDLSKDEEIEFNQRLASICDILSEKKDAPTLNQAVDGISSWMSSSLRNIPFSVYRKDKYNNEVASSRRTLCSIESKTTECKEAEKNHQCELYELIKKQRDKSTPEGRLAQSSDKAVNGLLRKMIGQPDNISVETRNILIAEGILPKNTNGEYVEQPEIPERQPEAIAKGGNTSAPGPTQGPVAGSQIAPTPASKPVKKTNNASAASASTSNTSAAATTTNTTAPNFPSFDGNKSTPTEPDMTEINNEILKRLSQAKGDSKVSKDEARKAVADVYKEQGRPITPAQESTLADQMMSSYNTGLASSGSKATLTPGETPKEQWEKEQKLKALGGMAGASGAAARAPASEGGASDDGDDSGKKLSTVAVNISPDKVKLNLSDILNDKIVKNDSEGQLLKVFIQNKKDFILQVNDNAFKVKYDKSTGTFKVSFESGDPKEGAKIKPQLEKFFKRMNESAASKN